MKDKIVILIIVSIIFGLIVIFWGMAIDVFPVFLIGLLMFIWPFVLAGIYAIIFLGALIIAAFRAQVSRLLSIHSEEGLLSMFCYGYILPINLTGS